MSRVRDLETPSTGLVIRADATPETGAGHVMRCCALAEAWIRLGFGEVRLWGAIDIEFVSDRVAALKIPASASQPGNLQATDVLLVDSYARATREQCARLQAACRILVDDLGCSVPAGYQAVWNPNAYGTSELYPNFPGPVITGPDAVALRSDLPEWKPNSSGRIFVTLGARTIDPLLQAAFSELSDKLSAMQFCGVGDWLPVSWMRFDAENPWPQVASSERLITAAGSSTWEAAAVGVPTVLIQTAMNQALIAEWCRCAGIPVVDGMKEKDPLALADELFRGLQSARPVPLVQSSSARVASAMARLCQPGSSCPN